jgi:hypothetical protein
MISTFTVVLDANVLYRVRLTSILLFLAEQKMFRARWTSDIHDEWVRNLKTKRPDLDEAKIEKRRQSMDAAVPDALVDGYQSIRVDGLPDADDEHVVAAALLIRASMIVTFNVKDFPDDVLKPLRLEARHPDDFLLAPTLFSAAARLDKAHYRKEPLTTVQYLDALERAGVPKTVARLRDIAVLLD